MASWDSPVVPSPTVKDYAPPVVDWSAINNLQKDYYQGADLQRNEDKANLFRNGIPRQGGGTTGPIDFDKTLNDAAKVGGLDYAKPLLELQMGSQVGKGAAATINGGPQPTADAAPAPYGTPRPSPRVATPLPGGGPPQPAPQPGATDGQDTIRSLATEWSGGKDAMPAIGSAVRTLRINPDAPLTPDQAAKVKSYFGNAARPATVAADGSGQPAAPQVAASPTAAPAQAPQVTQADRLDAEATYIRAQAAQYAAVGQKGAADTMNKEADVRADKAKQLRDQGADAPAIKEWRQSGSKLPYDEWVAQAEGSKETAKEDAKLSATKYATLVENGTKAQTEIPQLELLQEQMNDPNFFSGAGEKYNLLYKRLKSAVGMDPDAAVPQEILRKVTASNVLSSLGALKGLGPIRVAEMNMAREAAAAPDNSIPANKMLVEISKRTHQRNAEIADMAQTYKDQNGSLDPAFDKKVTSYYKSHPLFSDPEIKDWHKIIGEQPKAQAASAQPAQMPTFATPSAVHAANLPSGTKFKDASGVVRMVP